MAEPGGPPPDPQEPQELQFVPVPVPGLGVPAGIPAEQEVTAVAGHAAAAAGAAAAAEAAAPAPATPPNDRYACLSTAQPRYEDEWGHEYFLFPRDVGGEDPRVQAPLDWDGPLPVETAKPKEVKGWRAASGEAPLALSRSLLPRDRMPLRNHDHDQLLRLIEDFLYSFCNYRAAYFHLLPTSRDRVPPIPPWIQRPSNPWTPGAAGPANILQRYVVKVRPSVLDALWWASCETEALAVLKRLGPEDVDSVYVMAYGRLPSVCRWETLMDGPILAYRYVDSWLTELLGSRVRTSCRLVSAGRALRDDYGRFYMARQITGEEPAGLPKPGRTLPDWRGGFSDLNPFRLYMMAAGLPLLAGMRSALDARSDDLEEWLASAGFAELSVMREQYILQAGGRTMLRYPHPLLELYLQPAEELHDLVQELRNMRAGQTIPDTTRAWLRLCGLVGPAPFYEEIRGLVDVVASTATPTCKEELFGVFSAAVSPHLQPEDGPLHFIAMDPEVSPELHGQLTSAIRTLEQMAEPGFGMYGLRHLRTPTPDFFSPLQLGAWADIYPPALQYMDAPPPGAREFAQAERVLRRVTGYPRAKHLPQRPEVMNLPAPFPIDPIYDPYPADPATITAAAARLATALYAEDSILVPGMERPPQPNAAPTYDSQFHLPSMRSGPFRLHLNGVDTVITDHLTKAAQDDPNSSPEPSRLATRLKRDARFVLAELLHCYTIEPRDRASPLWMAVLALAGSPLQEGQDPVMRLLGPSGVALQRQWVIHRLLRDKPDHRLPAIDPPDAGRLFAHMEALKHTAWRWLQLLSSTLHPDDFWRKVRALPREYWSLAVGWWSRVVALTDDEFRRKVLRDGPDQLEGCYLESVLDLIVAHQWWSTRGPPLPSQHTLIASFQHIAYDLHVYVNAFASPGVHLEDCRVGLDSFAPNNPPQPHAWMLDREDMMTVVVEALTAQCPRPDVLAAAIRGNLPHHLKAYSRASRRGRINKSDAGAAFYLYSCLPGSLMRQYAQQLPSWTLLAVIANGIQVAHSGALSHTASGSALQLLAPQMLAVVRREHPQLSTPAAEQQYAWLLVPTLHIPDIVVTGLAWRARVQLPVERDIIDPLDEEEVLEHEAPACRSMLVNLSNQDSSFLHRARSQELLGRDIRVLPPARWPLYLPEPPPALPTVLPNGTWG